MRVARISTVLIAVLAVILGSWSCSDGGFSGPPEQLTIGYTVSEGAGLVYIAEDRGFFTTNGVQLVHKFYDTGAQAMEALLKNEVDIAGMTEVPFISAVFQKKEVSIYATLNKVQFVYLIGRRDRGIQSAADLRGKRIGLPQGTVAEFYLGRFLELNGLRMQDVTVVGMLPPSATEAVTSGAVDGVVVWNPFAYRIRQQLGEDAVLLRVQSSQPGYAVAVARNTWIAENQELLARSLKAVAMAERYAIEHPAEAKAIVQKRLNYDTAFMETVWPENQYFLSLDQALITAMEDESRWMIRNSLTSEKSVPDFMNYVHIDTLKGVKPEAVRIVR